MPVLETQNFGPIAFDQESVLEFPRGLPGFEECRQFVLVQIPQTAPLVFLQSLEQASLCFTTMPVQSVDPDYRLHVIPEDLALVDLPAQRRPRIGHDVLCLAVLAVRESGPTANLLAPLVVNLANRKGVQAVAPESDYSHRHALLPEEAMACS
jgi:flagellar assembly factor FliW